MTSPPQPVPKGAAGPWHHYCSGAAAFLTPPCHATLPLHSDQVPKGHEGEPGLGIKIAAGLTTGAIGISVASPTDLVKVRDSKRCRGGC